VDILRVPLPLVDGGGPPPRRNLLVRGNLKLGPDILSFSLPAGETCPGETDACRRACYAKQGNFRWACVEALYAANLRATAQPGFVRRLVREIKRRCGSVVRWHVAGDFYSADYARKVLAVVRRTPEVRHYFYTRSWQGPSVRPVLLALAREPNVRQWWSCDWETGTPFPRPEGVRFAWMQSYAEEAETHAEHIRACDLVFRVRRCRRDAAA
jgi:hypothetical protein